MANPFSEMTRQALKRKREQGGSSSGIGMLPKDGMLTDLGKAAAWPITWRSRGMFEGDLSPVARDLVAFMDEHKRSAKAIATLLRNYYDLLGAQGSPNQADVFGDNATPDKKQLLDRTVNDYKQQNGEPEQGGLFGQPAERSGAGERTAEPVSQAGQQSESGGGDAAGVGQDTGGVGRQDGVDSDGLNDDADYLQDDGQLSDDEQEALYNSVMFSRSGNTAKDIADFYDHVQSAKENGKVILPIHTVDTEEARALKAATGLDLQGFVHELDNYGIKHAVKKHGSEKQESARGQVAITRADFQRIPDIIRNYDSVEYVGKNKTGRDVILYKKQYDDTVFYAEEVRDGKGKKRLTLQTLYKSKGGGSQTSETQLAKSKTPSATPFTDTLRADSEQRKQKSVGSDSFAKQQAAKAEAIRKQLKDVLGAKAKLVDVVDVDSDGLNGDARYSLNESADSAFARAVDDVANGRNPSHSFIKVGTTPEVLKMIGLPDAEVSIRAETIKKVLDGKHDVASDVLKKVPSQINNPVAVLRSSSTSSNPDGYLVLTELAERDNRTGGDKPLVAALHLRKISGGVEIINIASVYGRRNKQIETGLESDALYWHKEKGRQYLNSFGLQLPTWLNSDGDLLRANIKTNEDLAQAKQQDDTRFSRSESTDAADKQAYEAAKAAGETELTFEQWQQVRTPEFKAWFGDWEKAARGKKFPKVLNPRTGEPLVVYHGTPNEFSEFSYNYIGAQGTADGQGFYFTDDAQFTENYQQGSGNNYIRPSEPLHSSGAMSK